MYKKTIKYTDFDGVEKEEDFYFNFTKAELTELASEYPEGLDVHIKRVIAKGDQAEIVAMFKKIVLKAYGEKDGIKFRKRRNGVLLCEEFADTEAYSELFMELATDEKAAADFFNGIVPKQSVTDAKN